MPRRALAAARCGFARLWLAARAAGAALAELQAAVGLLRGVRACCSAGLRGCRGLGVVAGRRVSAEEGEVGVVGIVWGRSGMRVGEAAWG